ncbi:MAG: Na(+)/H(+) antiporter subunit B [Rhizobiales bacterium]|nr:Na(+)/H(+) antiporter subunit B [Hyphomicrobiales bacterium]
MNTLILRTIVPLLTGLMVIYSIVVLLAGHNEPGGGFIGGLIAASAFALYGIACGVAPVRRALYFHPISIAAFGMLLSALSGVISYYKGVPFLTGLWWFPEIAKGVEVPLSTPLMFDIGVWLVVVGSLVTIALALEEKE